MSDENESFRFFMSHPVSDRIVDGLTVCSVRANVTPTTDVASIADVATVEHGTGIHTTVAADLLHAQRNDRTPPSRTW